MQRFLSKLQRIKLFQSKAVFEYNTNGFYGSAAM